MSALLFWLLAPTLFLLVGAGAVFLGLLVADLILYGGW